MKNFTVIPNEILENSQLSVQARYLHCVLIKHCGRKDWCFPGQKKLGKELGYTARYIRDLLRELESNGLIEAKRNGFNRPNNYKVAKTFNMIRKQDGNHLGSKIPLNEGDIVPPNSTYIKAKEKKSIEIMREKLTEKGILRPSKMVLKGKLDSERKVN